MIFFFPKWEGEGTIHYANFFLTLGFGREVTCVVHVRQGANTCMRKTPHAETGNRLSTKVNKLGRMRTPIRVAFSYGIRHISLWFNGVWPYASLNHNEKCRIPYENASRTGVHILPIITILYLILSSKKLFAHTLQDRRAQHSLMTLRENPINVCLLIGLLE